MNEALLRKYIQEQLLKEGLLGMFVPGYAAYQAVKWITSDDEDAVKEALEEVQDVITDLQDAVEDMIDGIEYDIISDIIMEQGESAVATIKAGMDEARANVSDAVKSTIEGDEELMKEVPLGEADKMANIAILAAFANVVASLTGDTE